MTFSERGKTESLAEHLLRNADALGLDQGQRARLRHAYRLGLGDRDAKRDGQAHANQVRLELVDDLDQVVLVATARGERVTIHNDAGAKRIKSRDGLGSLAEGTAKRLPAITAQEAKDGMAYRLLWEMAGKGAGLGSQLEDRPRAIRDSSHGAVAHGLMKAYVGVRLTGIETAVSHADASGRALNVLRAIAGEGRTLRSLGQGGDVKRKNLAALRLALRITRAAIEGNYGLRTPPPAPPTLALIDLFGAGVVET